MSRPFGSKNKPRGDGLSQSPKENKPVSALAVPRVPKIESKIKTLSTIESLIKNADLLCGVSTVKSATTGLKIVEGWVNMQRAPDTRTSTNAYYTGADIHETAEIAKKHASHATVGQFFVQCGVSK